MVAEPPSSRRVACVDVPALPLQLVLQAHPDWRADPVVVVEHERPEARILWANRAARDARIQRGQRFREAEALATRLHAAVVAPAELERAGTGLLQLLLQFSPVVEPVAAEAGHFFVDASGLHELFTGLEAWASALHAALVARGFVAAVVVGFARFPVAAVARARTGWLLLRDAAHERELADAVPFAALAAPLALRTRMHALGVRTLGEFLALPAGGLVRRFGKEAHELHRRATAPWTPLTAAAAVVPLRWVHEYEIADADLERFVAALADGLQPAFAALIVRREALAALRLKLQLEHAAPRHERLATAAPTRDLAQVLELVRLRFAAEPLAGPIERFTAELEAVALPREQLALLAAVRRRDLGAAGRALARVAAAFGDDAVTRARLVPAHLPERSFAWQPIREVCEPRPPAPPAGDAATAPPLVRTLRHVPEPLGTLPVHEPEAWLGELGAVQRSHGPYRLSGSWWAERVERDYFFLETDRGAILWVFHDRRARRWYLQGRVD
jgi:protein ImuB